MMGDFVMDFVTKRIELMRDYLELILDELDRGINADMDKLFRYRDEFRKKYSTI